MPDPIWQCLSPIVAPWPLIRAFENAVPPSKPYAAWSLRSASPLGRIQGEPDAATGVAKLYAPTLLRAEMNLFGRDAVEMAQAAELRLSTEASLARMGQWGLSLARMPVVNNLSGTIADPQNEERAVVELVLNAVRVTDDLVGIIEHVRIVHDPMLSDAWQSGCDSVISSPGATTQPPS